jgi:hypothetical protein
MLGRWLDGTWTLVPAHNASLGPPWLCVFPHDGDLLCCHGDCRYLKEVCGLTPDAIADLRVGTTMPGLRVAVRLLLLCDGLHELARTSRHSKPHTLDLATTLHVVGDPTSAWPRTSLRIVVTTTPTPVADTCKTREWLGEYATRTLLPFTSHQVCFIV